MAHKKATEQNAAAKWPQELASPNALCPKSEKFNKMQCQHRGTNQQPFQCHHVVNISKLNRHPWDGNIIWGNALNWDYALAALRKNPPERPHGSYNCDIPSHPTKETRRNLKGLVENLECLRDLEDHLNVNRLMCFFWQVVTIHESVISNKKIHVAEFCGVNHLVIIWWLIGISFWKVSNCQVPILHAKLICKSATFTKQMSYLCYFNCLSA